MSWTTRPARCLFRPAGSPTWVAWALIIVQAHAGAEVEGGTDHGQERVGQAVIAVSALCWLVSFVLIGVRHEADRVLAALAADRSRSAAGPSA